MIKKVSFLMLAALLAFGACQKTTPITPPAPGDKTAAPEGQDDNGNGSSDDGSGSGSQTSGTLCTDIGQTPIVLTYFTEYNEKLPDPSILTHINYAHGRFKNPKTGDGGIVITESKQVPISKVIALKEKNPKLKVMVMIGGWGGHADGFSEMAKDPAKRTEFCHSVHENIKKHQLDGVDIDWEYPTQSADNETGCDPNDTKNFNLVLKELRDTLGTSKIISFASSSSAKYVDWKTAMKYLDYVNVMTYDMGAAPDGHNSPLHKGSKFNHRSWDESIDAHVKGGVPKNRQVMGIPIYGKAKKNPSSSEKIFDYTVKYYEMDEILNKGTYKGKKLARPVYRRWDTQSMVPYLVDDAGVNVLSYDDEESASAKGKYVKDGGELGCMFWEYRYDDSKNTFIKAVVKALYGKDSVL